MVFFVLAPKGLAVAPGRLSKDHLDAALAYQAQGHRYQINLGEAW